jgi:hypothetical protein
VNSNQVGKRSILGINFRTNHERAEPRTVVPANAHTIFVFNLPYAIPVPDGEYYVRVGTNTGSLKIKRVQREQVEGFSGTGTIQMPFDKYGKSSFSNIILELPWIVDLNEGVRGPLLLGDIPPRNKAKATVLRFINRFIETARYVTKQYWVEPARYQDLLSYETFYWDGTTKYPARLTFLDTGIGGIRIGAGHPFQIEQGKIEKLKDLLANESELDASQVFILNSKDACLQEDYRLATIESVTALEVILYKFIRFQGRRLKISPKEIDDFIISVGLTGNISVVLKMLTDGLEQIDENTLLTCKGAITTRNKILHEGLRDIAATETEERVVSIEKMVDYLRKLLASIH